jgi:hypothetical protein
MERSYPFQPVHFQFLKEAMVASSRLVRLPVGDSGLTKWSQFGIAEPTGNVTDFSGRSYATVRLTDLGQREAAKFLSRWGIWRC